MSVIRLGSRRLPRLVKWWFLVSVTRLLLDLPTFASRWLDLAAAAAITAPHGTFIFATTVIFSAVTIAEHQNSTAFNATYSPLLSTIPSQLVAMGANSTDMVSGSLALLGPATSTNSSKSVQEADAGRRRRHRRKNRRDREDMSLWIDKNQVKVFSGYAMEIFAIANGHVQPYILDPNFEEYLPVIPSTVGYVNFTWKSGSRKYLYHFDRLESFDQRILEPPVVSVERKGRVPKKPKMFSVFLPCSGNATGVAGFSIGLNIQTRKGKALPGTPLRLRLRKECTEIVGPDPECDKKCANGGWCNHDKICQCPEGYMGQYCTTALCYPQCMNGGSCTKPGVCSCPPGFHGNHCEGGICQQKCLNNGKCIQKDTCLCPKGFYGSRCEFSKCVIPCLNGGRCRGVNVCRCPWGFRGAHCEIDVPTAHARKYLRQAECRRPCRNGYCVGNNRCKCEAGWYGKLCHRRNPRVRSAPTQDQQGRPPKRKRIWV